MSEDMTVGERTAGEAEFAPLAAHLAALAGGRGGSVLVEGDPGIGKTALLARTAREAARIGCRVLRAAADGPAESVPLRPLLAALDRTDGPQRTAAGDVGTMLLMDRLTAHLARLAADGPLVLLLDDLHRADADTLLAWQRLGTTAARLPLLLVAAVRRGLERPDLGRLRRGLRDQGAHVLSLTARSPQELERLAEALLGTVTGPSDGPGPLPGAAVETLRLAALLGPEFGATELAAATGQPPSALFGTVDAAVAAGLLDDAGDRLAFRRPAIRQKLYDGLPPSARAAAHRRLARGLADSGAPRERVAEQLLSATDDGRADDWTVDWIGRHAEGLVRKRPEVAVELLQRVLQQLPADDPRQAPLERDLATAAFRLRRPECTAIVRRLLDRATTPDRRALLTISLAHGLFWEGRWSEVLCALDDAGTTGALSPLWDNRIRALRALTLWSAGRHDEAGPLAAHVVCRAQETGDTQAEAYGRHTLALGLLRQRRPEAALAENSRALTVSRHVRAVGQHALENTDVRLAMLVNRAVMLGMLDRPMEALEALREARGMCEEHGIHGHLSGIGMTGAVLNYWTGRWDAALADLDAIAELPMVTWLPVLRHGVAALIHGHRDHDEDARTAFAALRGHPDPGGLQRGHASYRIMAGALMAERDGRPHEALAVLLPTLSSAYARDLDQRYQWLPDVVRLALAVGDRSTAQAAAAIGSAEAEREPHAGRTAAARRSRGLVDQDPAPLLAAADSYTRAGRPLQAGQALEDTAAVAASLGDLAGARGHLDRAVAAYERIGAAWDIRRAEARLRVLGVRPGQRAARGRPDSGWAALTPTELKVARLVAEGRSNPEIAAELYLSRRTVQTHVSHILRKLGVRSRTEVARQAAEHAAR
ncbi:LuxR C-terminal-related transcriptional regulator [Streptomyces sp. NPDC053427]|uniref:helix-turn-helix transcriptional regulator n=1 Tax=Streptomyces sp. NPDC053427 TaxID=3365701 RepID=UPI0037D2826E